MSVCAFDMIYTINKKYSRNSKLVRDYRKSSVCTTVYMSEKRENELKEQVQREIDELKAQMQVK